MRQSTVLVVDDEKEIADFIELYLKNENYNVHKFYNGKDALACVEHENIDLAILDVMLPDIDGFEILKQIRLTHNFPVIMLTAKVSSMDKINGLTLGADDYIEIYKIQRWKRYESGRYTGDRRSYLKSCNTPVYLWRRRNYIDTAGIFNFMDSDTEPREGYKLRESF